jgi:hypothetical protein
VRRPEPRPRYLRRVLLVAPAGAARRTAEATYFANPKMAWDIRVDGLPRHCEGDARANCERLVDHGMSSI